MFEKGSGSGSRRCRLHAVSALFGGSEQWHLAPQSAMVSSINAAARPPVRRGHRHRGRRAHAPPSRPTHLPPGRRSAKAGRRGAPCLEEAAAEQYHWSAWGREAAICGRSGSVRTRDEGRSRARVQPRRQGGKGAAQGGALSWCLVDNCTLQRCGCRWEVGRAQQFHAWGDPQPQS